LTFENSNYCLDSSAWIEYLDGTPKGLTIKDIIEEGKTKTSIIAIAEIADRYVRNNKDFRMALAFIKSKTTILDLSMHAALMAPHYKKKQRMKKTKFGLVDGLHIATAHEMISVFLTADKDFEGMERVQII